MKNLKESQIKDMTKDEMKSFIRDVIDTENKKKERETEEKIKKIVREMFKKQFRTFWEKSSFYIDKL